VARIGFDILVTTEDGYDDEDDFINWAQCALDAFALPPGVKRVEVLRPAPSDDDTGKNYG
jgi:hypothetical protein